MRYSIIRGEEVSSSSRRKETKSDCPKAMPERKPTLADCPVAKRDRAHSTIIGIPLPKVYGA